MLGLQNRHDFQLHSEQENGQLFWGDSVKWLKLQDSDRADLILAGRTISKKPIGMILSARMITSIIINN